MKANDGDGGTLDLAAVRGHFPLFQRRIEGESITYLDNAATSLKPRAVIEAVRRYDEEISANIHRGKHTLSEEASTEFEDARRKVARFIGARPREVIFVSGATAAINLVALGLDLSAGSNIVTTLQEHHSNLLPWYGRCEVRLTPVDHTGRVDPEELLKRIDGNTRLVTLAHASNATGAVQPIEDIVGAVRRRGVPVLVDGAQSVPHLEIDVARMGCDFFVFSGHKMLAPTGTGVLYGSAERLEALGAPIRGGGAVNLVSEASFSLKPLPYRLEPGTPNIAGVLGLGAAVDFICSFDRRAVARHEATLTARLVEGLVRLPAVQLLGPPAGSARIPLASVRVESSTVASDHLAMLLSDRYRIMVRSGHHCCHPYFDSLGGSGGGALRASAHFYNTVEEIDRFVEALGELLRRFMPRAS